MPAVQLPIPGVLFATTDRGGQYMGKLNAIAAAIDAAIGGFNMQLQAANDAQLHAQALAGSLATAAASATKAQDWADKAVDVVVESGKYSAKHHATKAAASAGLAAGHVTTSSNNATKAGDWAEKAEDVAVEAGKYSAKHHAAKAAASSVSANTHRANAALSETKAADWAEKAEDVTVAPGQYSAKHHAAKAAASSASANTHRANAALSETKAADWAEKAENSPVSTGKYSAKHYAAKAEYWANQSAANSSGAMVYVGGYSAAAGTWPAGALTGHMYRISAAGTLGPFADGVTRPVGVGDMIIRRADATWDWFDAMDSQFKDWFKQASPSDNTPGAMLTVGAGGVLSSALAVTSPVTVADLNNHTLSGKFGITTSSIANLPSGVLSGSVYEHYQYDNDDSYGTIYDRNADRVWHRRQFAGSFKPWRFLWDSGSLVKQASTADATPGVMLTAGAYGWGGAPLGSTGVTELKTLPYTAWFITDNAGVTDLPAGWAQGRYYVQNVGKPTDAYAMQLIYAISTTAPDDICRTAIRRMRNAGVWSDPKIYKFVNDPVDRTTLFTAAGTINKTDTVTRAAVAATTSFAVAIASSGYAAGDSIELSIAVASGAVVTLTATQSMAVTGGTAGTSHTITGPRHINVRAVFNGSTWQLFIS